ncbi:cell division protein FtsA [Syntrophomonas palmitatica]|uniref:cell division protein FtsA n=1 Tax=Syntrophomonas palmitatica TaxID=402877 RepID=UPI001FA815D0|nr:cell division protein FtsA [Syntrophomonas palmitatica]
MELAGECFIISKRKTIVSLDIGSNKIKAAVAEVYNGQDLSILGISQVPSAGVKKGQIVDIESNARAIDTCLNELERLSGVEILSALLGFSGTSVAALNNHAVVAVSNPNYEINQDDKERVLQSARSIALPPDKNIIQTIERQYIVDGFDGVKDPVGMVGSRLEAEVTIVIAATAAIQNIQRSAARINLHINQVVYNPLLAAEAVLSPTEKEMGVILLDIGAGTIEISVFQEGSLSYTAVIPVGDEYITKDLAIVLRTSMEEAARIKETSGVAAPAMASDEVTVSVKNLQGKDGKQVSQQMIAEIINARLLEIMEMVYEELQQFGDWDKIPGGIVVTGGGAELNGLCEFMELTFNVPVRLGVPENVRGIATDVNRAHNAAVLGGLLFAARNASVNYQESKGLTDIWTRLNDWFKDLFR